MKTTDEIMAQAQVFASAWGLVGSRFDSGNGLDNANEQKAVLRSLVEALAKERAELLETVSGLLDAFDINSDNGSIVYSAALKTYNKAIKENT